MIGIEDLDDVAFGDTRVTLKTLNKGCFLCPRGDEEGAFHLCMDGCFSVPRREKAGTVHKLTHLEGLIRERIIFDTFVDRKESMACETISQASKETSVLNFKTINNRQHTAQTLEHYLVQRRDR